MTPSGTPTSTARSSAVPMSSSVGPIRGATISTMAWPDRIE